MRKRRLAAVFMAAVLTAGLCACTESKTENTDKESAAIKQEEASSEVQQEEPVTLTLMQYKPEITDQVYAMAEEYHKQNPNVTIEVEILQDDYLPVLKSKINSNSTPDIFMSSGYSQNEIFADYCYDFAGDPILEKLPESTLLPASFEGKVCGIPLIAEGYGIVYNKDIFEKCEITKLPETLDEFSQVCKILKDNGYIPMVSGYKEAYIISHVFTKYYAAQVDGSQEDFSTFAKKVGEDYLFGENMPVCDSFFDYMDIVLDNCEDKPAETDFNAQMSLFAQEKAAMFSNGTWSEGSVKEINPDIRMGFMTVPGQSKEEAKLMVDTNVLYCLNKDSENLLAAKDWMEWMVTSEYGEKFIVDECGFIPTVEGWHLPDSELAADLSAYLQSGKAYSCAHGFYPDGYFDQSGAILQNYVVGSKNAQECMEELNQTWKKLKSGNEQ